LNDHVHSLRSALSQKNILDLWQRNTILLGDESGYRLSNCRNAQRWCITSGANDFIEIMFNPLLYILVYVVRLKQLRIEQTSKHSSVVADGRLTELLWISNIALCQLIKWITMTLRVCSHFTTNLLGTRWYLPSDCVLCIQYTRIYLRFVEEKSGLFVGEQCSCQSFHDIK
jgi:hypothetical protein